jgi:hypothetical protein
MYQIRIREVGGRCVAARKFLETEDDTIASRCHSEFWNDHCAHTDRFRSSLLKKTKQDKQWKLKEVINW